MIYLMFFVLLVLIYLIFNTTYSNKRKLAVLRAEFDLVKNDYENLKEKSIENKFLIEKAKTDMEEHKKVVAQKLETTQTNDIQDENKEDNKSL